MLGSYCTWTPLPFKAGADFGSVHWIQSIQTLVKAAVLALFRDPQVGGTLVLSCSGILALSGLSLV